MRTTDVNKAMAMIRGLMTNCPGEHIMNDSLHFGLGIYCWAGDMVEARDYGVNEVRRSGCFSHIDMGDVTKFLEYLLERDGVLYIN